MGNNLTSFSVIAPEAEVNAFALSAISPSDPVQILKTFAMVTMLNGIENSGTRETYSIALFKFFDWVAFTGARFTRADVKTYIAHLKEQGRASSTRNNALNAIRRLAKEAYYAGRLPYEEYQGIREIQGAKKTAVRAAQWLTLQQANELLTLPNVKTLKGLRDRALLGVLIGCALRRQEICDLTAESIQQRNARWVFIVRGKGDKTRTVGIAPGLMMSVKEWQDSREYNNVPLDVIYKLPLFPAMTMKQPTNRKLSAQTIQDVVQEYSARLTPPLPKLAPHDLRRTHARLAREAGSDLEQIQFALGHENVNTTQIYLGNNQNFNRTPGDMLDVDWTGKK